MVEWLYGYMVMIVELRGEMNRRILNKEYRRQKYLGEDLRDIDKY